jgi:Skp family chaperone for outer membrane proteins
MRLRVSRSSLGRLLIALCLAGQGAAFAQVDKSACATVSADEILRTSAASKAAQQRLIAEFKPQFDAIDPLKLVRSEAESEWLGAKRQGRPSEELDRLKERYEDALLIERKAAAPLRSSLDRRKREELDKLIGRANDIYKRLGIEQGFRLMLQHGEQEPVYILEPGATRDQCRSEVDLTSAVIQQLDQNQPGKP